ncbi:MAG: thioredoxin domain-containing protein [Desulfobacteraceae bacterium IS3]|nr:MAG: thioredoxin domain-containing protein [Desulfobacteraceae bacterium IS3]
MMSNHLIYEKSPYLLQHAHNPVNWYAWSESAFERAKADNKPVFLSIGYATCHWCHVMEKESFEDEETASYLNDTFICIKVDREERPDIDAVYMSACQLLSGGGGWPLTIFMTPDKKPFFAATYIPKRSQFGRAGVIDLCIRIKELWTSRKQYVLDSAESVAQALEKAFAFNAKAELDASFSDRAYQQIEQSYDPQFGGFNPVPKFPMPHRLMFLLRYYQRTGHAKALEMVRETLSAMRLGGIWDHIGFGFHRYSTDAHWLLPHFEKMLYDQALMALACLETYQLTREQPYADMAHEIFTYVLRDMTAESGGFFTAEDADSEGHEGKFYVWTKQEFEDLLGKSEAEFWGKKFNLTQDGNFSDEATRQKTGANILHLSEALNSEDKQRWETARAALFNAREKRIHPLKDDKILTDWNGLMIAALAFGARVLDTPEYLAAAEKASEFIMKNLRDKNGGLLHRYRDGEAKIEAFADDYAFLILGLSELYDSSKNPLYLEQAVCLQKTMIEKFRDNDNGGFFMTAGNELPARPKELYDGALPSANSVALLNLLRLSRFTGDSQWKEKASEIIRTFAGTVKPAPSAYTYFMIGAELYLTPQ